MTFGRSWLLALLAYMAKALRSTVPFESRAPKTCVANFCGVERRQR